MEFLLFIVGIIVFACLMVNEGASSFNSKMSDEAFRKKHESMSKYMDNWKTQEYRSKLRNMRFDKEENYGWYKRIMSVLRSIDGLELREPSEFEVKYKCNQNDPMEDGAIYLIGQYANFFATLLVIDEGKIPSVDHYKIPKKGLIYADYKMIEYPLVLQQGLMSMIPVWGLRTKITAMQMPDNQQIAIARWVKKRLADYGLETRIYMSDGRNQIFFDFEMQDFAGYCKTCNVVEIV